METPDLPSTALIKKLLQELRQISQQLALLRDEVKQHSVTTRTVQERKYRDEDNDATERLVESGRQRYKTP